MGTGGGSRSYTCSKGTSNVTCAREKEKLVSVQFRHHSVRYGLLVVPQPYPIFNATECRWEDKHCEKEGEHCKKCEKNDRDCERWIYVFRSLRNNKIDWYREIKADKSGRYFLVDLEDKKMRKKDRRKKFRPKTPQDSVELAYKDGETTVDNFFCLSRIQLPFSRVEELRKNLEKKYPEWLFCAEKKPPPSERLVYRRVNKSTRYIILNDHFSDAANFHKGFVVGRDRYLRWLKGIDEKSGLSRPRMKLLNDIVCDVCGLRKVRTAQEEKVYRQSLKKLSSEQKEELEELYKKLRRALAHKGIRAERWNSEYHEEERKQLDHIRSACNLVELLKSKKFRGMLRDYESGGDDIRQKGEEYLSRAIQFLNESQIGLRYLRERYKEHRDGKDNWVNWLFSPAREGSDASFRLLEAMIATIEEMEGENAPCVLEDLVKPHWLPVRVRDEPVFSPVLEELAVPPEQVRPSKELPRIITATPTFKGVKIAIKTAKRTFSRFPLSIEVLDVDERGNWLENINKKSLGVPNKIAKILYIINLGLTVAKLAESKKTSDMIKNLIALAKEVAKIIVKSSLMKARWAAKYGRKIAEQMAKRWAGVITGVVDAFLGAWDAIEAYNLDDLDAAMAAVMGSVGGVLTIVGFVLLDFVCIFAAILIGLVAAILLVICRDDDLEAWVKHCYWGEYYGHKARGRKDWAKGNEGDRGFFREWVGDPDQQILAFYNMWYDYKIFAGYRADRMADFAPAYDPIFEEYSQLTITIKPTRIAEQSEFILSVWIRNDKGEQALAKGLPLNRSLFPEKSFGTETEVIAVDFIDEEFVSIWLKERSLPRARARGHTNIGVVVPTLKNMIMGSDPFHRPDEVGCRCEAHLYVFGDEKVIVPSWGEPKRLYKTLDRTKLEDVYVRETELRG